MIYHTAQICGDEAPTVSRGEGGKAIFVTFGTPGGSGITMERRHVVAAVTALMEFEQDAPALQAAE